MSTPLLDCVERETGADPQWTVLWLHGLGADGHDFEPIVPELVRAEWPALRFVFPHAPVRAITINNGVRMRAWYDIASFDFSRRADETGVDQSIAQVGALIAREAERGVPASRLILAGFSQGGAITYSLGARREAPLAGLVALSAYLPNVDKLASFATPASKKQPVFSAHGLGDPVVPLQIGQASAEAMRAAGYALEWKTYPMGHQVCAEEIRDLGNWMSLRFSG
ncbi:MAG: alpha/beta hydrolase [Myxococcales bacterium]